jgi:delta 1-pyrroline-5-carboxylate dehydrogenase
MSKKKRVIFLVLLFLVVSVSLFAGRVDQRGGRNLDGTQPQGRGSYALAKGGASSAAENTVMSRRMNQIQNTLNSEDCLYLETGERQFANQEQNIQGNNRQQLNSEDCLYLETGERQFINQGQNTQSNNRQQLNTDLTAQRFNSRSSRVR